jgi:hypothetical protein
MWGDPDRRQEVAGMCFRRSDRWTKSWTEERREDELTYLFDDELKAPDRPMPVADREPDETERSEERERVPAGVDG